MKDSAMRIPECGRKANGGFRYEAYRSVGGRQMEAAKVKGKWKMTEWKACPNSLRLSHHLTHDAHQTASQGYLGQKYMT